MLENFSFIRKISQHQEWLATWEVEYSGQNYLVRLVQKNPSKMNQRVLQILDRQIEIHNDLLPEDQEQLVFFSQKFEMDENSDNGASAMYCRPWLEGETLESQLTYEPMAWQKAVQLIEQIAEVIAKAHNRYAIWHGDLKPENIIQCNGKMCIIDWDAMQLSNECQNLNEKTLSVESMGTPYYMSPEQCGGAPCTQQSDVYALGVMLYRFLTGNVPFANTNILNLWTKKQTTPITSILAEHAALNIPTELGMMVDKTLAIDANLRIQTVNDFLSSLRYAAQLADPAAFPDLDSMMDTGSSSREQENFSGRTSIPTPPPIPEKFRQKKSAEDVKSSGSIVLVGHTQSGKTVLAAGLYATSSETFTVTALDEASQTFAINTKSVLDDGNWPAATSKGQVEHLRFKLLLSEGGFKRAATISFKEYAGERMNSPNYCQEIIGAPNGVLLLMNPGAFASRNSRERNQVISEMKTSIDYMATLPEHPAVALVITAADRLQGDLKDYEEKFRKLVKEISDTLTLSKLVWKSFEVSVCKPLENQLKPELDPQNIQEPFIWLLNKERAVKRTQKAISWGKYAAAALFALFCLFMWVSHADSKKAAQLAARISAIDKKFVSVSTSETKNLHVQALEEAIKDFPEQGFWFDSNKEKYNQSRSELFEKADKAKYAHLESIIIHPANPAMPLDSYTEAAAKFRAWEPYLKKNQTMKTELEGVFAKYLPPLMPKCVKWLESTKGDEFTKRYNKIQKFVSESISINKEIGTSFKEYVVPLKTKVLINQINNFAGTQEQLGSLILECAQHAARDMQMDFTKTELASSLLGLVEGKVQQAIAANERNAQNLAEYDDSVFQYVENNIASWGFATSDANRIITQIRDCRSSLASIRQSAEQTIVDDFIRKINNVSADEALTQLKQWYFENTGRISDTSRAENAVNDLVWNGLRAQVGKCIGSTEQNYYTQLKTLCMTIKATPSVVIQKSRSFIFANSYVNWYDNNRKISIALVKMEGKCTYGSGGYIWKINNRVGPYYWYWTEGKYFNTYRVINYSHHAYSYEPWQKYTISIENYIDNDPFSDSGDGWELSFHPKSRTDNVREYTDMSPANTCIRLTFQVSGTTLGDLWNEVIK